MRSLPSAELVDLLEGLNLASPAQVRGAARLVRRLAGDLPHFDSVWVDALAHVRRLTAYQAREINSGRGRELAIGSYRICDRLPSLGYADAFLVRDTLPPGDRTASAPAHETLVLAHVDPALSAELAEQLTQLVDAWQVIDSASFRPVRFAGTDGNKVWLVASVAGGVRAADWMVENGRFPPHIVLHIARQMLAALMELEQNKLLHGDLHVRNLHISADGRLALVHAGIRSVLRPREGFSMADLPPECYETLASERVVLGTPATTASEIFACGCLWWHLLTGRPAIAGGNGLAKLKAAAEARIPDVRQLAPDCPPVLAEMIVACTSAKAEDRPQAFSEMARILGPPSDDGRREIRRCLRRPQRWLLPRVRPKRRRGRLAQHVYEVATAAACIFVMLAAWRVMVRPGAQPAKASSVATVQPPSRRPAPPPVVEPTVPAVNLASYAEAAEVAPRQQAGEVAPLQLPTDRVLRLASLSPAAGQTVCGADELRARVVVPASGLVIDQPDVHFEDIDFIAEAGSSQAGMIVLRTSSASFNRCTFRGPAGAERRTGIEWQPRQGLADNGWDGVIDRLAISNCVFHSLDAAVERQREEEADIEMINSLHLAGGSLLRMPAPARAAPVTLTLRRCTLRETGAAVAVTPAQDSEGRSGRATISATDCVFALRPDCALVELTADDAADGACPIRWQGKASVLEVNSVLLASRDVRDVIDSIDESRLEVVGLARSPLQFYGDNLELPAASELRRWQAPRQSLDPPGVIVGDLPPAAPQSTDTH